MPGPLPKPADQRRRRNVRSSKAELPRSGRSGPPPKWPLSKVTAAESAVWRRLWALPQAVAWERLEYERVVARYVRLLGFVESRDPDIKLLPEVRQLEDRLGLSPLALLRLEWSIVDDEPVTPLRPVPSAERWQKLGA